MHLSPSLPPPLPWCDSLLCAQPHPLSAIMRVSPSERSPSPLLPLRAVGKRVPAVAVTLLLSPAPQEGGLAPLLLGLLFLAHTCCPSTGCDFRVSSEHSTLSHLNLILKLFHLVLRPLTTNIPLGFCDKLLIPCQGPVIPALKSMGQKNSPSQISNEAALCPPMTCLFLLKVPLVAEEEAKAWPPSHAPQFSKTPEPQRYEPGFSGHVTYSHTHRQEGDGIWLHVYVHAFSSLTQEFHQCEFSKIVVSLDALG